MLLGIGLWKTLKLKKAQKLPKWFFKLKARPTLGYQLIVGHRYKLSFTSKYDLKKNFGKWLSLSPKMMKPKIKALFFWHKLA
jgi:hypothetical protein